MRNLFRLLLTVLICIFCVSAVSAKMLKASITAVPNYLFGSWRVVSQRIETDSPMSFKDKGLDLWNLSRDNDVITLSNPFSGASAQIQINSVNKNHIIFSKTGKYDNKVLSDTVSIKVGKESFTGTDELRLDTVSDVDGKIIKSETAIYSIRGEKIAGQSVIGN